MPKYIDVIKFESEAPAGTIRLIKSGEFYRAYNHSAWLFHCCIAEHKVMRKYIKAMQADIYYVGFPEKSLWGNIGELRSVKTEYGFDLELAPDELPDEAGYETWRRLEQYCEELPRIVSRQLHAIGHELLPRLTPRLPVIHHKREEHSCPARRSSPNGALKPHGDFGSGRGRR